MTLEEVNKLRPGDKLYSYNLVTAELNCYTLSRIVPDLFSHNFRRFAFKEKSYALNESQVLMLETSPKLAMIKALKVNRSHLAYVKKDFENATNRLAKLEAKRVEFFPELTESEIENG